MKRSRWRGARREALLPHPTPFTAAAPSEGAAAHLFLPTALSPDPSSSQPCSVCVCVGVQGCGRCLLPPCGACTSFQSPPQHRNPCLKPKRERTELLPPCWRGARWPQVCVCVCICWFPRPPAPRCCNAVFAARCMRRCAALRRAWGLPSVLLHAVPTADTPPRHPRQAQQCCENTICKIEFKRRRGSEGQPAAHSAALPAAGLPPPSVRPPVLRLPASNS